MPKGKNVLIPVTPLAYTSADADPQQAEILRPGWLHVYRNEELWRDIAWEYWQYLTAAARQPTHGVIPFA